jgi:hypothetical protein
MMSDIIGDAEDFVVTDFEVKHGYAFPAKYIGNAEYNQ